jgi:SAM-dependent methyltransferase
MNDTPGAVHRANGLAWDQAAAIYEDGTRDSDFVQKGGNSLLPPERRLLGDLRPWCRRAIHLQCSGGWDAASLIEQGAHEVVGIDISPRMIAVARRRAQALGLNASFYVSDVLDTPHELNGSADLVYTGKGALPWIMDLEAWARVVARLLAPEGLLYVFEGHPLDWVWDSEAPEYRLDNTYGDYFDDGLNGMGFPNGFLASTGRPERARMRQWRLGEVMNALVAAGLTLERFEEHPDLFWNQFPHLPDDMRRRLPHTYSLLMRKQRQDSRGEHP